MKHLDIIMNVAKNSKLSIVLFGMLLVCVGCSGDLGSGKHISEPAVVLSVGDCGGGEGLFSGPRVCAISVRWDSGGIEFAQTWDYVMIGQTVFRECWVEDEVEHCFLGFTHSPRKMYRAN